MQTNPQSTLPSVTSVDFLNESGEAYLYLLLQEVCLVLDWEGLLELAASGNYSRHKVKNLAKVTISIFRMVHETTCTIAAMLNYSMANTDRNPTLFLLLFDHFFGVHVFVTICHRVSQNAQCWNLVTPICVILLSCLFKI